MRTNPPEFMEHKWQSSWRTDAEGHADCGIFYERHPGHAYALLRAPKYFSKKEWEAVSSHVIKAHESHEALVAAAQTLRCLETSPRFQGMTVAEAIAELKNNGACGDAESALNLAGAA